MSLHFFISRAGEDSDCARWIARVLKDAGHRAELPDDFRTGSFEEHMQRAMDSAGQFIAVLSPHYLEGDFTRRELRSAVADKLPIVPVRVAPCEIPRLIKDIVYIDFVGKDDAQRKQALLEAIGSAPGAPPLSPEIRTSTQRLPTVDPHVFGRDWEDHRLEQAWANPETNFVQIIAPGGAGKTALMTRWYRGHLEDATIFGWSFHSQGTREKSQISSDPFFAAALPWFGITVPATESIFTKVDLLVDRLRQERVLLILDGIELLQDPQGGLRDLALKALLQELAARNAGMVLSTTRLRLTDVPDEEPRALSFDLDNLDPTDGARYLRFLGVHGPVEDLQEASDAYDNHALALTLLGAYLVTFREGEVWHWSDIRDLQDEEIGPGRHARKVLASYANIYHGRPEMDILRALGHFDRPAEPDALKLVLPPIKENKYRAALKRLHDARLILTADPAQPLDCHPLIREYFSKEAARKGHARLYEHYQKQAPHQPDTLEEMTPLFYAVYHACQAGQHQAALKDIYMDRILRGGGDAYLVKKLGALGTNLSLLANFFDAPWTQPAATLAPADRSWVISEAGFALRAVGRLADAIDPMRASAEAAVESEDWKNAAIRYSNLSELLLTLGSVTEAVAAGRRSVDFADRSGHGSQKMLSRATLADALHQSGDLAEAMRQLAEAERIQAESLPEYPILTSLPGYRYCDLLLGQGQTTEVRRRASRTLHGGGGWYSVLDIGLDHLSLGRAHPSGSPEAVQHLDQAVDFLRRAATLDRLPWSLLARGTPRDLDEVFRIANRSGMRLYLTDYHLASARLALYNGDGGQARAHFEKAATLIQETGYHRRDPDLEKLRSLLT